MTDGSPAAGAPQPSFRADEPQAISPRVRPAPRGRESHCQLDAKALEEAQRTLHIMSRQWDDALARLKTFVED